MDDRREQYHAQCTSRTQLVPVKCDLNMIGTAAKNAGLPSFVCITLKVRQREVLGVMLQGKGDLPDIESGGPDGEGLRHRHSQGVECNQPD